MSPRQQPWQCVKSPQQQCCLHGSNIALRTILPAEWTGKSITPKTLGKCAIRRQSGGKLTDHNAPSKPPEQIKRMIVVERINKLVDIGKVIAGKAYQRGKFTQAPWRR